MLQPGISINRSPASTETCVKQNIVLKNKIKDFNGDWGSSFISRHPVMANVVIIAIIAVLGIYAAYFATALFTKHGRSCQVPGVEGRSYTEAISILHDRGFKVDIRDSLYKEDVRPGFVIEQFPKSNAIVKPGRKIFLSINAVHPREVIIDDNNHPNEYAMKGDSYRSALAKLEELGFKRIKIVKVLGSDDRVVKVMANGRVVRKMQKVPVSAAIVVEISDGRLNALKDSLQNEELMRSYQENPEYFNEENPDGVVEEPETGTNTTEEPDHISFD